MENKTELKRVSVDGTEYKDEEEDSDMPRPPDGGWGWVVVFASFMIHVIADGVTYTFGIFYVEFLSYFGESKGATAWVASILVGVTLGSGPIASSFVNKYGCRAVTIVGAIVAAAGLMVSLFAPNILTLYFTIGMGTGMGFGFIYLPAIVSVTCYFEKHRAFATGIAVCGSGLGTFIFAPLTEWLVVDFGWKGAMLVISALVLNCVIFGALFRPLERSKSKKKNKRTSEASETDGLFENESISATKCGLRKQVHTNGDVKRNFSENKISEKHQDDLEDLPRNLSVPKNFQPEADKLNFYLESGKAYFSGERVSKTTEVSRVIGKYSEVARMAMSHPALLDKSEQKKPLFTFGSHGLLLDKQERAHHQHRDFNARGVMYRRDILYAGSLVNIPQYRSNPRLYSGRIRRIQEDTSSTESEMTTVCGCIPCSRESRDTLREMMDLSLLKNPIFMMFAVSNFCTSVGFNVPYVYIVDRALKMGITSENASFLLSIIGIANTVGRVFLGYISDKPWLNRLYLYNFTLTICGFGTAFSSFCLDYPSLGFYAALFGSTIGAYVGLTSVILVDLLGLDKLTNAFGLLLLFQGVASIIGPPIAGWLYDYLESYDPGFYMAGTMIALSGIMLFFIPCVQKLQARKERKKYRCTNIEELKPTSNGCMIHMEKGAAV